jgi:hypothetical protein
VLQFMDNKTRDNVDTGRRFGVTRARLVLILRNGKQILRLKEAKKGKDFEMALGNTEKAFKTDQHSEEP